MMAQLLPQLAAPLHLHPLLVVAEQHSQQCPQEVVLHSQPCPKEVLLVPGQKASCHLSWRS